MIFLLIGYIAVGIGPDGFSEIFSTTLRILISGSVIALYYSLIGMAVATLTNKAGVGSAVVIMLFLASTFLTNSLVDLAEAPDWVRAFSLAQLPMDIAARIFDEPSTELFGVSTGTSIAVFIGAMVVSLLIITWGYRRLEVTK